jgi:hypothetical protein
MWLPTWLYERLPLVYLAAAMGCLAFFGRSGAVMTSAMLFSGAALLTYLRRRDSRASASRDGRARAARRPSRS